VAERAGDPSGGNLGPFIDRPAYHMEQYVPSPVDLQLTVSRAGGSPGILKTLDLVWLEAIGSPSFRPTVDGLIDVHATLVGGSNPAP